MITNLKRPSSQNSPAEESANTRRTVEGILDDIKKGGRLRSASGRKNLITGIQPPFNFLNKKSNIAYRVCRNRHWKTYDSRSSRSAISQRRNELRSETLKSKRCRGFALDIEISRCRAWAVMFLVVVIQWSLPPI